MTAGPLASLLLEGAADRPFAVSDGGIVGFHRFRRDVASLSARVAAVGCRRGLVVAEDAYWTMVGFFALAHAGAETLLPPNTLPSTLGALAGSYDYVLAGQDIAGASGLRLDLLPGDDPEAPLPPFEAEQVRIILLTSGSTGTPKHIVKTVRQLEIEALTVERVLGQRVPADATVHGTVPHQHLYGLTFRLCWPLATCRAFHGVAQQFWQPLLAEMKPADVLVTSPSHLSRLDAMAPLPPQRRPSAILSGGAPLSVEAARTARTVLGCDVREFFGSTEAGVIASRLRSDDTELSWHAMPGIEVTRLDDNRLHVRSPYLADPDGEETEDLIEPDADGGFHLRGRADRVAKIEGIRISLTEFEARLRTLAGVQEGSLVMLDGATPYLGGVVVLDAAGAEELARIGGFRLGRRLRSDLARTLPQAALPRRWRFVAQMPVGPLGKVRTSDLAALFTESQAG